MDGLTNSEQQILADRIQKWQMKQFMGIFGNLVDSCFTSCVDDFQSKALSGRETGCLSRCVSKWMATNERMGERFAELNAAEMERQQRGGR
ncbi:mitochondrial import inner membrane translocase subunit tim-9 [Apiosordaria backusii]|uniref:Mitochondrial import inner membrane translocase subunit n=1 Tax=Apiosordaria backusii TaxID=314023 RepID=A0AA40K7H3_9PEZI|nr:mitochondrial import inner membrane translocase subunit tim-9 [Apiosordaria backusii]